MATMAPPFIRLDAKRAPCNAFSRGVAVIPQAMGHSILIAEVLALPLRPRRFYTVPWGGSDGNAVEANEWAFQQMRRRDVKTLSTVAAIIRRYRAWER